MGSSFTITKEDIEDRSKADWFTKVFALVQCGSLVIGSIARAVNGLMITQLELTTLTFVLCAVIAYILWLNKPFDAQRPITIDCSAGDMNAENVMARLTPSLHHPSPVEEDRLERVIEVDWLDLIGSVESFDLDGDNSRPGSFVLYVVGAAIVAIQLAAWNWDYPNTPTRYLWRAFALGCLGSLLAPIGGLLLLILVERITENAFVNDITELFFGLLFILVMVIYAVSRVGLFVLSFYCLSSLPPSAYESVDWTDYIPRFS
jgi:hypothetical protein